MTLLTASQLTLKQGERELVRELSFAIETGQSWIILGENGCGKSTLLSAMAGWFAPQSGQIALAGQPITALPPQARARALAWQPQQDECPFPLSVLEKTLTGRHPHLGRWQWESADDLALARTQLARLDLAGFDERNLASLSGGERRRVALATALTQQAPLLLLDEPLSQLDLRHQQQALTVLREEQLASRSVVMVSHDPNHATQFATHALLLFGNGEWLAGELTEVLTAESLSRLYHHTVLALPHGDGVWFVPAH
ncbi:ABC transporter ATP-binding protein [Chitinibacteraceae bacterium HSL-7]